jgi:hypothetical protein
MRIILIITASALLVLSTAACTKQSEENTPTETLVAAPVVTPDLSITLTKPLIDRYIKTLPAYAKIAKAAGEPYENVNTVMIAKPEVVKLLKDDGWQDPQEFVNVHGKIWGVSGWIGAYDTMKGEPQSIRDTYTKTQYQPDFLKSNVSDAEKQLLWDAQPKLLQAVEKAEE